MKHRWWHFGREQAYVRGRILLVCRRCGKVVREYVRSGRTNS